MATETDPREAYEARRQARQQVADAEARRDGRLANARLAVALVGLGLAWASLGRHLFPWPWLAIPAAAFLVLVVLHDRALKAGARARRAVAFYDRGIARIEDRWQGGGQGGDRFADPHHPFALDLDLFGKGSLFELLSTARTGAGEATLARWLLEPADPDSARARQQAVADLAGRLDLREDLALLGDAVQVEMDTELLVRWATAPGAGIFRGIRWVAGLASAAAVVTLAGWIALGFGPVPFVVALCAVVAVERMHAAQVKEIVGAVDRPGRDLKVLAALLARLEAEAFEAPHLVALEEALASEGVRASERIAVLGRLVDLLDARRNQFFAPVAYALLWPLQLADAIERWRAAAGPLVPRWLEAMGGLEALSSLAAYACEHPDDVFPELVAVGPVYEGEGLGHPLLPARTMVRNDVRLGKAPRVLVVSGSNMSGKSTLLRTVGINAVLAQAGAPVRARSLRLSPLRLGATLRIQDSLQEGASRFYAEITRLKQVVDLASGPVPVLFLLDEILHGTNSHDRRIGAEAVIRGLVAKGAVGLVTTHDLALSKSTETLGDQVRNVHFEDHLEDGRIAFDYRMREGVVEKSNALELMRAVGLDL